MLNEFRHHWNAAASKKHQKGDPVPNLPGERVKFGFIRPARPIETSFIGKCALFEGRLDFHDIIKIDGCFKGEIISVGQLVVGPTGVVIADVHVTEIIVNGEVRGNIKADKSIEILHSGKVFGDIRAPEIAIDHCAVFKGNCSIGSPGKLKIPVIDLNRALAETKEVMGAGVLPYEAGKMSAKSR